MYSNPFLTTRTIKSESLSLGVSAAERTYLLLAPGTGAPAQPGASRLVCHLTLVAGKQPTSPLWLPPTSPLPQISIPGPASPVHPHLSLCLSSTTSAWPLIASTPPSSAQLSKTLWTTSGPDPRPSPQPCLQLRHQSSPPQGPDTGARFPNQPK